MFPNREQSKSPKPMLAAFVAAVALTAASTAPARSLWQVLDNYGFKTKPQKEALIYLLKVSGVADVEVVMKSDNATDDQLFAKLIEFVQLTQQQFTIRTGTQERWDVKTTPWMEDASNKESIIGALSVLNMIEAIKPNVAQRDAICILGARKSTMDIRLGYAPQAMPAEHLILLAGERYVTINTNGVLIDGSKEDLEAIAKKHGKKFELLTETDLIKEAYENSVMKGVLTPEVIDTPRGDLPRPTTETTLLKLCEWLKERPAIKSVTFVSNQPHVQYQRAIIDTVLKEQKLDLIFEVVGPELSYADENGLIQTIKDAIGALGSFIYAATPNIVADLRLKISDPSLKDKFVDIYKKQPLVYRRAESVLKPSF